MASWGNGTHTEHNYGVWEKLAKFVGCETVKSLFENYESSHLYDFYYLKEVIFKSLSITIE